jgi:outer membrane receptor for ferrienterochelin and colicins
MILGKITADSTRDILPGANIFIEGTNIGTASDASGNFIITRVPAGEHTLLATMIGYKAMEKKIMIQPREKVRVDFNLPESVIEMNEIVVTGTGMPQLYEKSPVKTAMVRREDLESFKAANLAQAIDFTTGVRVEGNCQNCNFTQVRLLGLEGHHAQILIDSDPVISSLAGVYGLEQIPQEMIERVEIIKGGGSSLYGGQAMAGVINLITRRPTHNEMTLEYDHGSIENIPDRRFSGTLSRVNHSNTLKGVFYGMMRERDPYDHNGDGFSEIGQLEHRAAGANIFYIPNSRNELSVQLHAVHEDRRGGNKFHLSPHHADIAEWAETNRYGGALAWKQRLTPLFDYKAYASFAMTDRHSYYGAEMDPNAYGLTTNPLFVGGLQSNYRMGNHTLIAGVQYSQDAIQDEAVAYDRLIDEKYSDIGLIFQNTFQLTASGATELVYGVRFDKHSAIQSVISSPRIALRSNVGSVILRGGYSSGFKAPQVFDEDLHITQVGGEGQIIKNSNDLKEERGNTFYGGIEYQELIDVIGFKLSINGFLTRLKDTFILVENDNPATDEFEFSRINGHGSRVQGIEAEVGLRFAKAEITSGITVQSSLLDEPEPDFGSTKIFRTPDIYGNMVFNYDVTHRFGFMMASKYTGPMFVPHYAGFVEQDRLEKTRAFLTVDLVASYKIPLAGAFIGIFTAGVYNLTDDFQDDFDQGIYRDAGYVYGPMVPRRVLFGFSIGHDH